MDVQKGCIYFSSFYVLAEILAIPAVPILTASSGYLFGTVLGTATCLFSASIAASISFVIGRTFLRYALVCCVLCRPLIWLTNFFLLGYPSLHITGDM